METNYKGMKVVKDLPGQVEYNRRKNVEQDQRLSTLSTQVADLLAQEPAGYLPEVFYGLNRGNQTYRFNLDYIFNVPGIEGDIGDSYQVYDSSQTDAYIPAIAVQTATETLKIVIQGDYPVYGETFMVVNMKTGDMAEASIVGGLLLQDASYLGAFDADDYQNKQITVLHDLESNKDNELFCSIDLNSDGDYNWISIGNFTNGADGKCVYSMNIASQTTILGLVKAGDSLVIGQNLTIGDDSYLLGDILTVDTINPLTLTKIGNIRGPQGETGQTGATGQNGADGATPTIVDNYWYINGTSTGVKAVGTDGTNGTDGKSFETQSGLYSVPANEGATGNVDPDGNALLTLPTLPTTGISGKGYVVFDPLTTPLQPYYDLYWANDGDNDWTIIHPFSGINGQDGSNGETPYIGANGHWWTGTTDSGIDATGPQGPAGPDGIETLEGTQSNPVILLTDFANKLPGFYYLKGYIKGGSSDGTLHEIRDGNTNQIENNTKMLVYYSNSTATTAYFITFGANYTSSNFYVGYSAGEITKFMSMSAKASSISSSNKIYMNSIPMPLDKSGSSRYILTTDNTVTFTPTADYHPATKKYVDDAVANAGGGSSLYRHNLYVSGTGSYFGLWCEIINSSSTAIATIGDFTAALYNAGYKEPSNAFNAGECLCNGWYKSGSTFYRLVSIFSSDGTDLIFKYNTSSATASSYSDLYTKSRDSGPVANNLLDVVIQIS